MTELGLYTAKYKAVLIQVVQGMKGEAMRTKNLTCYELKRTIMYMVILFIFGLHYW